MSTNEPQHTSSGSSRRILSRNKPTVSSSSSSSTSTPHQEEELAAEKRAESSRLKLSSVPQTVASSQTKEQIKPDPNVSNGDSIGVLSQQQQHQQILMNQHNYLNKEPFNEDIEIEESSFFNPSEPSFNWRFLIFDRLKQIIEDMKKLQLNPIDNKAAIKDHYRRALLLCSTIKKLNRISNMNINKARIRTHEEKNKIDEHHLELQNLLYEISHLKKEINTCLEFRSLDEDINLVSIEEFFTNAPVEVSKPDLTKTDKHKLKLAQLDWELIQRQNMLNQIKDLENQIEQHERQLKLKQNKLESLHPKLNQIIESCKPTLDYFNTNFDDTCVFSEPIQYLPRPLYQFYMMIGAFRDTIDNEIQIQINGDVEEAKRVNLNETINILDDDDSDSGEDENEAEVYNKKKKSKSKANKKKTTNSDKIFQTYPLSCQVTFNIKGYGQLILELFYLHILKIITVKPEIKLSKDVNFTDNSMLRPETMFNCLFENDNGLESPNLSNKLILSNFGIKSIEPFMKQIGTPYRWCQILCGLFYETKHDRMNMFYPQTAKFKHFKDDNKASPSGEKYSSNGKSKEQTVEKMDIYQENDRRNGNGDENDDDDDEADANENNKQENCLSETKLFERILSRLKARFKARIALQEIICQLKSLNMSSLENINLIDNQMRFKIQSTVSGFKEISFEKFSSHRDNEQFLENELVDENSCSFFELALHNSNAQLVSYIAIHEDYPLIAPIFSIVINWKHERNFRNDQSIRCMEQEINLYGDNYVIKDANANLSRSMSNPNKRLRKSISSGRIGSYEDGNYDIFAKQLSHLLVCFDLYLETESASLNNYEIPQVKLFPNSVRGRDRRKPFVYMMSKNLFVQRMQHDTDS